MTIQAQWLKWRQTILVSLVKHMAYKLNFVLSVLAPALVFFFIQYNVWLAVYSTGENLRVAGYSLEQMLQYQAWVLIASLIAKGHDSMNLAMDIRFGHISKYLIYPFEFWQYHTASFLSFQMIQVTISLFSIAVFFGSGLLESVALLDFTLGFLFCLLVSWMWFMVQYCIGLIAFWMDETWVLRVIFSVISTFFSGGIFPLELFPPALRELLLWTPFPYMTYVPVSIFMGTYKGSIPVAMLILLLWIAVFFFFSQRLWRAGVRLYSAAGM